MRWGNMGAGVYTVSGNESAALLRPWIEQAQGVERSWTFADRYAKERALLYFEPSHSMVERLGDLALRLGLPATLVNEWRDATSGADALFLGFHLDFTSVRLYVQHWDYLIRHYPNTEHPLYQGFKRLPDGGHRVDAYRVFPMAGPERFALPIRTQGLALGFEAGPLNSLIEALDPTALIWTETHSANRMSWLATVRRVALPLQQTAHLLAPLKQRPLGIDAWRHSKTYRLTHLAGGQDSDKHNFTSLYFEDDPDSLWARLTSRPEALTDD